MMKITAVIPVRKGSQRVLNKNLRPFGKTNLLVEKLKTLKQVEGLDRIIVSSDSEEMLEIAKGLDIDTHKRPPYYASSDCPNYKFWTHLAKDVVDTEYIMLANCVAPLIRIKTYSDIIKTFRSLDKKYDSITTVENLKAFIWDKDKMETVNYPSNHAPNSQMLPNWVKLTFAVTITKCSAVIERKNIVGKSPYFYILDQLEGTDIDTPYDFVVSDLLYKNNITSIEDINKYLENRK